MKVHKVVIFGTSGHSIVIASIIETIPEYELIGFISNTPNTEKAVLGYKVIGDDSCLIDLMKQYDFTRCVVGVGDNFQRSKVVDFIGKNVPSLKVANCVHASAIISKHCQLGIGNVVMPGVTVGPSSVIADHCILNTNSSLDHDCRMDNFSSLGPNSVIGGDCSIGKFSQIGIGATVFHSISIGKNSVIGGASLVNKSIEGHSTYYGIPARFVKKRKLGDNFL